MTAHTGEFSVDALIDSWNELFDAVVGGEFDGFPVMPVLKYVGQLSGRAGKRHVHA